MHLFTILPIGFLLAASVQAEPHPFELDTRALSPQTKANITATIFNWLSDIARVNYFVDTVTQIDDHAVISSMAKSALVAAMDEGTSNDILFSEFEVPLDADGEAASKALAAQFNIIGPAIKDTIANPQNAKQNVDKINGARCDKPRGNNAILEENRVIQSAAKAAGIHSPAAAWPIACT